MITEKQLKDVFALLPSVNVFLNDSERSLAFASSLKDVGGRDDDVLYNIMYVRLKKKIINTVNISIEGFYELGSKTIIQISIGGDQKPIEDIVKMALDKAFISETSNLQSDYFRLVNYYTTLKNIIFAIYGDNAKSVITMIEHYILIVDHIIYYLKSNNNDTDLTIKQTISDLYNKFINGRYICNPWYQSKVCSLRDLTDALGPDCELSEFDDNVLTKALYPINIQYRDNKICLDVAGIITCDCFYVNSYTRDGSDISNLITNMGTNIHEICDRVFTRGASAIIRHSISAYSNVCIDAKMVKNGDIIIKIFNEDCVICIARISPKSETIIWRKH
jgi:hypothetical protein